MAEKVLEQQFNISTNIDSVLGKLEKGMSKIEKMSLDAFKDPKFGGKSLENNKEILAAMEKQRSVLKDIDKIKEMREIIPKSSAKEMDTVLGKMVNLQKKMSQPLDDDQTKSVVEENEKLVSRLGIVYKKYEKQYKVHKMTTVQLQKIEKINKKWLGPKGAKNIAAITDELMLANAQMVGLKSSNTKMLDETEKHIESLIVSSDKYIGRIESLETANNKVAESLKSFNEMDYSLLGADAKNAADQYIKQLQDGQKDINNLGDANKKEIEEQIEETKKLTEETDKYLNKLLAEDKILKSIAENHQSKLLVVDKMLKSVNDSQKDIDKIKKSGDFLKSSEKTIDNVSKTYQDIITESKELTKENEIDEKKLEELVKRSEEYLKQTQAVVNETEKEVDLLKEVDRYKRRGKALTKEEIKDLKEKRKKVQEQLGGKGGLGFFARKKAAKEIVRIDKQPSKIMAPIKATGEAFGEAGKNIGKITKPLAAVGNTLARVLPPLTVALGAFSAIGFLAAMVMMEKKVKEARRAFIGLAGETGELDRMMANSAKTGQSVTSQIEKYRIATTRYIGSLGLSVDDAQAGFVGLTKAGFTLNEITDKTAKSTKGTTDAFERLFIQATLSGKSIDEMTAYSQTMREEYAMTLDQTSDAFSKLREDARDAGISTGRFYDKVINTATGMALYGAKIEDVSASFAALTKNIKLPEKAASEAAAKMTGHFKDMSTEQQILVGDLSGYSKNIQKLLADAKSGNSEVAKNAMLQLGKMGLDEKAVKDIQGITDPLEQNVRAMRSLKPGEQVKATMNALSKSALGLDLNDSTIEDIDKAFKANTYKLEKVGESFGLSREDITVYQKLFEGIKENNEVQTRALTGAGMTTDEIKKWRDQVREGKGVDEELTKKLANIDSKKMSAEIEQNDKVLWGKFKASGKTDIKEFLLGLDTNFKDAMNFDKTLEDDRKKIEEAAAAKQMRRNTTSMIDALEMSVQKILLDIFAAVEPLYNTFVKWLKIGWKLIRKGFVGVMKLLSFLPWIGDSIGNFASGFDLENQMEDANDRQEAIDDEKKKNDKELASKLGQITKLEKKKNLTDEEKSNLEALKKETEVLTSRNNDLATEAIAVKQLKDSIEAATKLNKDNPQLGSDILKQQKQSMKDQAYVDKLRKDVAEAEKSGSKFAGGILPLGEAKKQIADFEKRSGKHGAAATEMKTEGLNAEQLAMKKQYLKLKADIAEAEKSGKNLVGGTIPLKDAKKQLVEFELKEPGLLKGHSPVDFNLAEPGEIKKPEFVLEKNPLAASAPTSIVPPENIPTTPMIPPENATTETVNNQTKTNQNQVVINVNQRDAKYVEQVVRSAIYESQK